ncbi:MAG: 50S ribosomal protein L6 [archaeon]|jgi:large subunit ribosomal protein L6|nr:50S ribosomal protein L6 [archaeon]
MKRSFVETVEIPQGISCEMQNNSIKCKKGSAELSRALASPKLNVVLKDNKVELSCSAGNKRDYKTIKSLISHISNMFIGLEKPYVYHLEACNVHFPMTIKSEPGRVVINNFLGEKTPRFATILPGVNVEIKGQKITVTSPDKEAAGQTAASIEKATKIRNRDRRIFQDGIFITDRPAGGSR